jgi:hypothetical protein
MFPMNNYRSTSKEQEFKLLSEKNPRKWEILENLVSKSGQVLMKFLGSIHFGALKKLKSPVKMQQTLIF